MSSSPEVRQANDIAAQFAHLPAAEAAAAVEAHVRRFWAPSMRSALVDAAAADPAALAPAALAAARALAGG